MKHEGHIYLQGDDEQHHHGPFTEQEIRRYWALGMVKDDDWLWMDGMAEGMRVKRYFDVAAERMARHARHRVLRRHGVRWDLAHALSANAGEGDKAWILQVFAWMVALAATACFLSLPGSAVWLSVILYVMSVVLLGWFIWIKKSVAAWISLGVNVALMVAVLFSQLHEPAKRDADHGMSVKVINELPLSAGTR